MSGTRPGAVPATATAIAALLVAAFALLTGGEKAQVLGLTQHGALVTAQDAGASDAVALVAVSPGTPGQVLTVSDAGLPHWAAGGGGTTLPDASGAADGAVLATVGGAQTWTQMWPGAVTVEDMTGTGWTAGTPGAGSTFSWSGGAALWSSAAGATAGTSVGRDTSSFGSGALSWDYAVRFQVTAGSAASPEGAIFLSARADASNTIYLVFSITSGQMAFYWTIGGVFGQTAFSGSGSSSGQRTGGQMWLRLQRAQTGLFRGWWGVGTSGALPTAWTRVVERDDAALTRAIATTSVMRMAVEPFTTALSETVSVSVLDIRSSWSGSL